MCFDQKSSLVVFTVGTLFSLALYKNYYLNNDIMSLLFSLIGFTVVIIQLFEFDLEIFSKYKKIKQNSNISINCSNIFTTINMVFIVSLYI